VEVARRDLAGDVLDSSEVSAEVGPLTPTEVPVDPGLFRRGSPCFVATAAGARYQELCVIMFGSLFRCPNRLSIP
jgi:hypothetical protein